jgi:hypothetical protein
MQTQNLEERLAPLKKEVPARDFERHPRVVKDIAELPTL